jgi:hypothetical protein
MHLRDAIKTLHADRTWWQKVLIGGALMSTLFGYPLAAGLVVESLDNTRKGFPTPLPPWVELSTRYILGLFGFLIDFTFYILPLFVAGALFFCSGFIVVLTRVEPLFPIVTRFGAVALGATFVSMFLLGVSPIGRLLFLQDSAPEQAMSLASLREALRPAAWRVYAQARLASLPAYLPLVVLVALFVLVLPSGLPFSWLIGLILYWLIMCAQLYAHLLVIQLYAAAESELQRRGIERPLT